MADPPAAKAGGKAFWTHKLGPFPVYVWGIGVVAVGGYYWYTHYGPGASKSQSGGQQQGKQQQTPRTRITETVRVYTRHGRGRTRRPRPAGMPAGSTGSAGAAGDAAVAAAAGVPAQYGGGPGLGGTMAGLPAPPPTPGGFNPGGPNRPPGRRDHDRDRDRRDRDKRRRHVAVGSQEQTTTVEQTGQPVDPDTGQPVYWEWTHAHRGPEISTPVPEPQAAYAPGTTGATNAASTAGAASTAADALAG